ncbi:hypothetical protein EYF80_000204 [Liparis tanakae]|uniref:Uncharacterized protein n=1 Tax=Liparis tanakae TaxID=230148 RepID=A0A4Z2JI48_9TELE|nr:hypothetical protein EYF80_000204 [Liparis tanakae]
MKRFSAVAFVHAAEVTTEDTVPNARRGHPDIERSANVTYRPGQLARSLRGSATLLLLIIRSGRTICRERRVHENEGGGALTLGEVRICVRGGEDAVTARGQRTLR